MPTLPDFMSVLVLHQQHEGAQRCSLDGVVILSARTRPYVLEPF